MLTRASRTKAAAVLGAGLAACFLTLRLAGWRMVVITPWWSDMMAYSLPKYRWAADRIQRGEPPLWNPLEAGGIPFLATIQPGVFYPPLRILYALVHTDAAYQWLFILHIVIGAFSTLALMRKWGASLWASVLASTWVANPAWLMRIYDHAQVFTSVALTPLLFWALLRILDDPHLRSAGVLAAVATLLVTAGYPPSTLAATYLAGIAFALHAARHLKNGDRERVIRATVAVTIAACLVGLVTAVQTLPTAELAAQTGRSAEAAAIQRRTLDTPMMHFLGFPPHSVNTVIHRLWDEYGPLPLLLALAAALSRPRTPAVWFAMALFALAALTPYQVLIHLPLYRYVRFAGEWSFLTSFSVFLIAGFGLDSAARRSSQVARFAPLIAALCVASVLILSWRCMHAMDLGVLETAAPPVPAGLTERCGLAPGVGGRVVWREAQRHGSLLRRGIESVEVSESLVPFRNAALVQFLGFENGIPPTGWIPLVIRERRLLARLGVTCVVTQEVAPELEQAGFLRLPGGTPPHATPAAIPYQVPSPTPRARLVFDVRLAATTPEALAIIASGGDSSREVVLESELAEPIRPCSRSGEALVQIRRYAEEEVRLVATTPCRGVLVLADSYYPGWQATIDESPAPILRADFAFRALVVEPGKHDVVFRYRPRSFALGALLSLLGLVLIVATLVCPRRLDPIAGRRSPVEPFTAPESR